MTIAATSPFALRRAWTKIGFILDRQETFKHSTQLETNPVKHKSCYVLPLFPSMPNCELVCDIDVHACVSVKWTPCVNRTCWRLAELQSILVGEKLALLWHSMSPVTTIAPIPNHLLYLSGPTFYRKAVISPQTD